MYFHYFVIISPWKRAGPFIWTNLNPLHPRMLWTKFGWNWPCGTGEEDENVKSLQTDGQTDGQTDRQTTDDRWSEKLTWAFSSGELKTIEKFTINKFANSCVNHLGFNIYCRVEYNTTYDTVKILVNMENYGLGGCNNSECGDTSICPNYNI